MRGKGFIENEAMIWGRITPAYAGKSAGDRLTIHIKWDHPRLCGEKLSGTLTPKTDSGSPPPMRGKVPQHSQILSKFQDHPRLCGEKITRKLFGKSQKGSPPPMRGKAPFSKSKPTFTGITPAYAGKSVPDILACVNG